jgi:hypothetical protein
MIIAGKTILVTGADAASARRWPMKRSTEARSGCMPARVCP